MMKQYGEVAATEAMLQRMPQLPQQQEGEE
jgi:hypothetical protein